MSQKKMDLDWILNAKQTLAEQTHTCDKYKGYLTLVKLVFAPLEISEQQRLSTAHTDKHTYIARTHQ
jgi:hypothetical protein